MNLRADSTNRIAVAVPVITVAVGYWASHMPPAPDVVSSGAWAYSIDSDPQAAKRLSMIVFGLVAPVAVAILAFFYDPRLKVNLPPLAVIAAGALASFAFGWRNIPYWANGVYRADIGDFPYFDFDPKALPPMIWIGPVWWLLVFAFPVLLLGVWAFCGQIAADTWLKRSERLRPILIFALLLLAMIPLFWRVRGYTSWLLD